jgi:hypothetical protein
MPGVGESLQRHEEYREQYQALLPELDLILWLIKADDRALSLDQQCYQELLQPNLANHPSRYCLSSARPTRSNPAGSGMNNSIVQVHCSKRIWL